MLTDDMDPRGQLAQLSKLEERGRNFYHTPACEYVHAVSPVWPRVLHRYDVTHKVLR